MSTSSKNQHTLRGSSKEQPTSKDPAASVPMSHVQELPRKFQAWFWHDTILCAASHISMMQDTKKELTLCRDCIFACADGVELD